MNTELVKETPWEAVITDIISKTTNLDFYRLVAAFFFEKKAEDVTSEERQKTKLFLYSAKYRDINTVGICMDSFTIPESIREEIRNAS